MSNLDEPLLLTAPIATVLDSVQCHLYALRVLDGRFMSHIDYDDEGVTYKYRLLYSRDGTGWHGSESHIGTLRLRRISNDKTTLRLDESVWCKIPIDQFLEQWNWSREWSLTDSQRRELAEEIRTVYRSALETVKSHLVEGLRADHIPPVPPRIGLEKPTQVAPYVDSKRILELSEIRSDELDLARVVRLCEELNTCYAEGCYFAVAMLLRALLDHVPPAFGESTFQQVANNIVGKSLRRSFQALEGSSRNIADELLHAQIRKREALPTRARVNFSADLDVVLGELARRLRP